jgi:6-pyruvoyltetrahydropterin/6-carboxytetrahydropterin synthase
MTKVSAIRYHDISCGHRVYGHESKCAHLHGHNYRIWFYCEGQQDNLGRVIDFSVIKNVLCKWLEDVWDHRFLIYEDDPLAYTLKEMDPDGVVRVPFNPTAENMAKYLLEIIAPRLFDFNMSNKVIVTKVVIEETAKCHAAVEL